MIIEFILIIFCGAVLYYLYNGAMYVPTSMLAVKTMTDLVPIRPGMKVVDLGSGDGRIVTAFATLGASAVGYEINPAPAIWSWLKIRRLNLTSRAHVFMKSFWGVDLSPYDVVIVFGISHIMNRLEQKLLLELKPGTIVISNAFKFEHLTLKNSKNTVLIYEI